VPENIEPCVERRYFSEVHYLALVCNDEELVRRLQARPAWRGSQPSFAEQQIQFNRWFKEQENGSQRISLIDTTGFSLAASAGQVGTWIRDRIDSRPGSA
jgi:hypothetical protein